MAQRYTNMREILAQIREEVDLTKLDENKDPKIVKAVDKLKKGDTVEIEYDSSIKKGHKGKFKVTAKNTVNKGRVVKTTLQNLDNPKGVKHFIYQYKDRDGAFFAIGDMGATMTSLKAGYMEDVDSSDTGGEEEVSMAVRQIAAIKHFLDDIETRVKQEGDMEEWYQNKLTKAHDYLKTIYAYGKGDMAEGTVYIHREYEPGQYYDGDLKKLLMDIKKAGGKVKDIQKPSRREPNLAIEVDGDLKKIKKQIEKDDDGLTAVEEETLSDGLDEMREPYAVVDTADGNKVVGTASDEKGAKSIISTSQLPPMKIKDKNTLKIVKVKKKQMIGQPIKEEEAKKPVQWPSQPLEEKLKVSDGLGAWIDDFKKSDAPQFQGKSDEEKKNMAIAAFTDAGGKLESVEEGFTPKEIKMAIGVAADKRYKGGNYTGAVNTIEKIKKGLSKHPQVAAVLKRLNTDFDPEIKEEEEKPKEPEKSDGAKAVDQARADKKTTRIAQLQLQIAKAQETINKLNAQEK
jgi:hypothetical protein